MTAAQDATQPMSVSNSPETPPANSRLRAWRLLAGVEVVAASVAVLADWFIPSLVLVGLAALSLVLHRTGPGSLGCTGRRTRGGWPARCWWWPPHCRCSTSVCSCPSPTT